MRARNFHFNKHPLLVDIVGTIALLGLLAWVFWILLRSVPYREIPMWML